MPSPLVERGDRGSGLGLDAALGVRAVQVGGTDLAAAEQLEALLEDVLELLLGAALEQHVPVRADRLLRLHLTLDAGRALGLLAAARTLPDRRDVRLVGHGDLELVALRTAIADLLARGELDAALVLETLASQPRSA